MEKTTYPARDVDAVTALDKDLSHFLFLSLLSSFSSLSLRLSLWQLLPRFLRLFLLVFTQETHKPITFHNFNFDLAHHLYSKGSLSFRIQPCDKGLADPMGNIFYHLFSLRKSIITLTLASWLRINLNVVWERVERIRKTNGSWPCDSASELLLKIFQTGRLSLKKGASWLR